MFCPLYLAIRGDWFMGMMELLPFLLFIAIVIGRTFYRLKKIKREYTRGRFIQCLEILRDGSSGDDRDVYTNILDTVERRKVSFYQIIISSELSEQEKEVAVAYLEKYFSKEMEKETRGFFAHQKIISSVFGVIAFIVTCIVFIVYTDIHRRVVQMFFIAVCVKVIVSVLVDIVFEFLRSLKENPMDKEIIVCKKDRTYPKKSVVESFCTMMESFLKD